MGNRNDIWNGATISVNSIYASFKLISYLFVNSRGGQHVEIVYLLPSCDFSHLSQISFDFDVCWQMIYFRVRLLENFDAVSVL